MKRGLGMVALVGVLCACSPSSDAPPREARETATAQPSPLPSPSVSDRKLVAKTWNRYTRAVLFGAGKEAARYISNDTMIYYDEIRRAAYRAGRDAIFRRPVFDRMVIGGLRLRFKGSQLRSMDAADIAQFSVEEEVLQSGKIAKFGLKKIRVNEQSGRAFGRVYRKEKPKVPTFRMDFVAEGETWKIDLLPLIRSTSIYIAGVAREEGLTLDVVIERVLEIVLGLEVPADLWDKPGG
jgi:hypothetical protein